MKKKCILTLIVVASTSILHATYIKNEFGKELVCTIKRVDLNVAWTKNIPSNTQFNCGNIPHILGKERLWIGFAVKTMSAAPYTFKEWVLTDSSIIKVTKSLEGAMIISIEEPKRKLLEKTCPL